MGELTEEQRTPPKTAQDNAKKVLKWREEHPDEVDAMTETGWRRANQLADGGPLSVDVISKMAQFNRHRGNSDLADEYKGKPWKDNGYVAWLGWGGDAGIDWAIRMMEKVDTNMQIVNFQTNNYEVQEKEFNGKSWYVVPVKAVTEQVLNGQLAPADEISKFVQAWDDIPVPVNHPTRRGQHVSARNINVLEQDVIGRFRNPKFVDNWLKGEIWIDIEKAKSLAENNDDVADALEMIENNEIMEVSTAYFCDVEQTSGTYNGNDYEGIQRNMRPDHLALLPNATGACSVKDGCGIRVNCVEGGDGNIKVNEVHTPDYSDTETDSWDRPTMTECISGYYKHHTDAQRPDDEITSVAQMPADMKTWIYNLGFAGNMDAENYNDLLVLPAVNPDTDALNENALDAVISMAPQTDELADDEVTEIQNNARELLNDEFDRDIELEENMKQNFLEKGLEMIRKAFKENAEISDRTKRERIEKSLSERENTDEMIWVAEVYDSYFIYEINETYYKQSYAVKENGEVELLDEPMEVIKETQYKPVENQKEGDNVKANEELITEITSYECNDKPEEELQEMETNELEELRDELAANCDEGGENVEVNEKIVNKVKAELEKEMGMSFNDMKQTAEELKANKEEKRKKMTNIIVANSDFEEEDLKEMSINHVEKLYKTFKPANYAGQGLPPNANKGENEEEVLSTNNYFVKDKDNQ